MITISVERMASLGLRREVENSLKKWTLQSLCDILKSITKTYIEFYSRLMFVQRQSNVPSSDLLDEICVRFILTLPATELESFERLLFSVEQAWWHYEVCPFQAVSLVASL
jgi:hypothetical protein